MNYSDFIFYIHHWVVFEDSHDSLVIIDGKVINNVKLIFSLLSI